MAHYYGSEALPQIRPDVLTDAGADDLVLFPCSGDLEQVDQLADAIHEIG